MNDVNGKQIKFRMLAERRVSKVLKLARQIGKLSRRTTYEYTDAEIEKMFDAMYAGLQAAAQEFKPKEKKQQEFTFGHPS